MRHSTASTLHVCLLRLWCEHVQGECSTDYQLLCNVLLIYAQCAKNGIPYNYLAGAAEQVGGEGGNRPPNVHIGGALSLQRWPMVYTKSKTHKILSIQFWKAIETVYTHSKLAQLTAFWNPDSNVGSLLNQCVYSSLNYCWRRTVTHTVTHTDVRTDVRDYKYVIPAASRLLI